MNTTTSGQETHICTWCGEKKHHSKFELMLNPKSKYGKSSEVIRMKQLPDGTFEKSTQTSWLTIMGWKALRCIDCEDMIGRYLERPRNAFFHFGFEKQYGLGSDKNPLHLEHEKMKDKMRPIWRQEYLAEQVLWDVYLSTGEIKSKLVAELVETYDAMGESDVWKAKWSAGNISLETISDQAKRVKHYSKLLPLSYLLCNSYIRSDMDCSKLLSLVINDGDKKQDQFLLGSDYGKKRYYKRKSMKRELLENSVV